MLVVLGDPWLSGWLVTPTLLFPCTLVGSVSFLALCNVATCSFSRLFSSSSSAPAIKKMEPQPNIKSSMVKRSSTFSQFPTEKSKTFDFLNEEWVKWWSWTMCREVLKWNVLNWYKVKDFKITTTFNDYNLIIWLWHWHCSAFWVLMIIIPKMFRGKCSPNNP